MKVTKYDISNICSQNVFLVEMFDSEIEEKYTKKIKINEQYIEIFRMKVLEEKLNQKLIELIDSNITKTEILEQINIKEYYENLDVKNNLKLVDKETVNFFYRVNFVLYDSFLEKIKIDINWKINDLLKEKNNEEEKFISYFIDNNYNDLVTLDYMQIRDIFIYETLNDNIQLIEENKCPIIKFLLDKYDYFLYKNNSELIKKLFLINDYKIISNFLNEKYTHFFKKEEILTLLDNKYLDDEEKNNIITKFLEEMKINEEFLKCLIKKLEVSQKYPTLYKILLKYKLSKKEKLSKPLISQKVNKI